MPPADDGRGHRWPHARANGLSPLAAPPGPAIPEAEFAAIIRRAAAMGIPAWRVSVALGRPLPSAEAQ